MKREQKEIEEEATKAKAEAKAFEEAKEKREREIIAEASVAILGSCHRSCHTRRSRGSARGRSLWRHDDLTTTIQRLSLSHTHNT